MTIDVKTSVRTFLIDNFRFGDQSVAIDPEESLIEAGFIDSTGVLELVAFLEDSFGITVADGEIVPANLDSLVAIERYVKGKSQPAASAA